MASIIKYFDIWGSSFTPTVAYASKQETIIGGLFGLIYCGLTILLAQEFGMVLIDKDSPNVIHKIETNDNNTIEFNAGFSFDVIFTLKKKYYGNQTEEQIKAKEYNHKQNNRKIFSWEGKYFPNTNNKEPYPNLMSPCNTSLFGDSAGTKLLKKLYCISPKVFKLRGTGKIKEDKIIILGLYVCKNSTDRHDCFQEKTLDAIYERFNIKAVAYYTRILFHPENNKQPLQKAINSEDGNFIIKPNLLGTNMVLTLQNYNVSTDNGLFFADNTFNVEQQIIKEDYYLTQDMQVKNEVDGVWRNKVIEIQIRASSETHLVFRSYPKLQDVISNIGGSSGLLAFAFQFFLQNIYDSKTNELIIHQIFDINEEIIDKSLKKEKKNKDESKDVRNNLNYGGDSHNLNYGGDSRVRDQGQMPKYQNLNNIDNSNIEMSCFNPGNNQVSFRNDYIINKKDQLAKIRKSSLISKHLLNEDEDEHKYDYIEDQTKVSTARQNLMDKKPKSNSPEDEVQNTKYSIVDEDKVLLSFLDHFLLTYLCCCVCGRTRKIANYYKEIEDLVAPYTDILNISYNMLELEKLKYILMDEDQIALFNMRRKIQVDKNDEEKLSFFSKCFYFSKDLNDSVNDTQIKKEILERKSQLRFNRKLIQILN